MPRNPNPHSNGGQGRRAEQIWNFQQRWGDFWVQEQEKNEKIPSLVTNFLKNESVARGAWGGLSGGRVGKKKKMRTSKTRG
ncbi:hypothetical protein SLEP1_g14952 [Rubroshorea leprosula]|uniref:Uncharacterized protein n=1 Tax=Rubroshorea leprosula TaxID=152421 RepID=A0AAV5IRR2_9ROSI|nr:hypothetical protein SLEP1_g14952 [Rubroshorea leprosula]